MTQLDPSALDSVRVLDLGGGIASSLAAMMLADFGADVVKVEAPGGDPTRAASGFAVWNRNKHSVLIDADDPAHVESLSHLLATADVCIYGGSDDFEEHGSVVRAARLANSRLVVLELPPHSPSTPWLGTRESNELLSAVTGLALRHSSVQDVPVDPVYPHVLYLQGIWGATCAIAALIERETSGHGQTVSVDGLQASLIAGSVTSVVNPDEATRPVVPSGAGGPSPCYTRYVCADGQWLFLGALSEKFQRRALKLLDLNSVLADDRIDDQVDRMLSPANNGWVREAIAGRFRTKPRDEWLAELDAIDCPAGPLMAREEWLDHPQVRSVGMRIEIDDPERGQVVMPGVPLILSATPGSVYSPAPQLGDRTVDDLGWSLRTDLDFSTPPSDRSGRGPLHGVRILNLGTVLAGPFAGSLLSDLGADVIKVEPLGGDSFRVRGFAFNRGSRSLAIDLRSEAGREMFYELVRSADVVLDNFRPGVLQRLQVDFASLRKINPAIVTMSLTGFGEGGPLSDKPGFDPILQAMSGMMTAQGGDGEPVFLTTAVNDVAGACLSALGIVVAVFHRVRTDEGQSVAGSLAAFAAFMQSGEIVRFEGRAPARTGGSDFQGPSALDRYYRTEDGWVRLQAAPHQAEVLAGDGWLPATADASWPDQDLEDALAKAFAHLTSVEAVERLARVSVPAGAAIRPVDLLANPGVQASDTYHEYPMADGGSSFAPGRTSSFSRTQQTGVLTAPGLGEHSREILAEVGVPATRIQQLLDEHVIAAEGPLQLRTLESYR